MSRTGRKRKSAVRRYPGGDIVYDRADSIVAVAQEARQRVFGLTEDQSRAAVETGVLGRLRLIGDLSEQDHETLIAFAASKRRYDELMKAPAVISGTDILAKLTKPHPDQEKTVVIMSPEEADARRKRQADAFINADIALIKAGGRTRWAVYLVAVEGGWDPSALEPLRKGAQVLADMKGPTN